MAGPYFFRLLALVALMTFASLPSLVSASSSHPRRRHHSLAALSSHSKRTTTNTAGGWEPYGCITDASSPRSLQGAYSTPGTIEGCLSASVASGFTWAGLQYGSQCFGAKSLDTTVGKKVADSQCKTKCRGKGDMSLYNDNSLQTCGDTWKSSAYRYTSPSSSVSIPTGWSSYGCVKDGTVRTLTGYGYSDIKMTVASCLSTCSSKGFTYAGLQYGRQCYCGSSFKNAGELTTLSSCSMPCGGDSSSICGGNYMSSMYVRTGKVSTSASTTTTKMVSSSSTRITTTTSTRSAAAASSSSVSTKISISTSASSTSTSVAATPTWTSLGCVEDYPYWTYGGRALDGYSVSNAKMTNAMCWAICTKAGFTLSGTEDGTECRCGNSLENGTGKSKPAAECSTKCAGDSSQVCGGGWRMSLYQSPNKIKWKLVQKASGPSFFDNWWFFDGQDPTNGFVDYLSASDAWQSGLISTNSAGRAIMKVETTPVVSDAGRKSVRISSQWKFNGNSLLILDAVHMPVGCGIWPAFWTLGGGTWPYTGEIDILEGVNFNTRNQVSVHTGSGYSIPAVFGGSGSLGITNCAAYETANQGCGIIDGASDKSYGVPFNNNGGGVYAMRWIDTAISVYFFPRGSIPADITANSPNPDNGAWGQPIARYPATSPLANFFQDHAAIFDTTLCGDWAGNGWPWGSPGSGQDQSCAALTGYSTCNAYVKANGADFGEAYWEVNSVQLYTL